MKRIWKQPDNIIKTGIKVKRTGKCFYFSGTHKEMFRWLRKNFKGLNNEEFEVLY